MSNSRGGWVKYSNSGSYPYYINPGLKLASWSKSSSQKIPNLPGGYHQLGPLGWGWEMLLSSSNNNLAYFFNHLTGETTWTDPRNDDVIVHGATPAVTPPQPQGYFGRSLSVTSMSRIAQSSGSNSNSTSASNLGIQRPSSASYIRRPSEQLVGSTIKTQAKESTDYDKALKDSLKESLITRDLQVVFDDIAGLDEAKQSLQAAVILPQRFPEAFDTGTKRGALLYGPPGTGKSLLAKALAVESQCTFFSISNSDIESKWVGESQRKVRCLFQLAREMRPSIIFIDEIDSLMGSRQAEGSSERGLGIKTEFLVQMDGVGYDNDNIFVLAATNMPWQLDNALLSRLQRKIYIPLPDSSARHHQLRKNKYQSFSSEDVSLLVDHTQGLSGRDIDVLLAESVEIGKGRVLKAKYFRRRWSRNQWWFEPCSSQTDGCIRMNWSQVPPGSLRRPHPEPQDVVEALEKVKPSVTREDIEKYEIWTHKYGSLGS